MLRARGCEAWRQQRATGRSLDYKSATIIIDAHITNRFILRAAASVLSRQPEEDGDQQALRGYSYVRRSLSLHGLDFTRINGSAH